MINMEVSRNQLNYMKVSLQKIYVLSLNAAHIKIKS